MHDVVVRQQQESDSPDDTRPPTAGKAFAKGGCGCLVAFLVIGILCVAFGGHMHIDPGGAILLFVI